MGLDDVEELLSRWSVDRHEVVVGEVFEQLGSGFNDVAVVLDEPFRTRIGLTNFTRPVVAILPGFGRN